MDRITICRDSTASSSHSHFFDEDSDFHGYELLLLKRLQSDPAICVEWREKLLKLILDDSYELGEIPHNLWYMAITLDRKKKRFLKFVQEQVKRSHHEKRIYSRETMLTKYLNSHMFTELHLDGIFKYGDDNTLPKEIFCCPSVRLLSMKYNYLDKIPPDIGRMKNLENLALTNNKLQNRSLPYTIVFCSRLKTLMLDNNNLDALPGFMLSMDHLDTVYRHGNHNYFKSTFMWYHTDVNERILPLYFSEFTQRFPESLQFWAAKTVIGSKTNFYSDPNIAPVLKDYISEIYHMFNICGNCSSAKLSSSQPGFKVITFKNPYLGNTCVPFQHWACSIACATAIEIPARREQIEAASALDKEYDKYVQQCNSQYAMTYSGQKSKSLLRRSRRGGSGGGSSLGVRSQSAQPNLAGLMELDDDDDDDDLQEHLFTSSPVHHHRRRHHPKKKSSSKHHKCVIC